MTNNDSTMLLIVAGAVLLIGLFFLLSPRDAVAPAVESSGAQSEPSTGAVSAVLPTASVPPVVNAGPDRWVEERETFRLYGEARDPAGLPLTIQWTARGGLGTFENAASPTTAYTAPSSCACETQMILTLTATNSSGASASDEMVLTVRNPWACPTTSHPALYVCPSIDPCTVDREGTTCPATPDSACDTPCIALAPSTDGCSGAVMPCPWGANDECSPLWKTEWPTQTEVLHPKERAKPSIDRHYPMEIDEETSVQLRAFVHNPSCQNVCYVWSVSKGWLENASTLTPIYHAPASDRRNGETVTITLTLYDRSPGQSYDQIRIKILNTSDPW